MTDSWWIAVLAMAMLVIVVVTIWEVLDVLIKKYDRDDKQ